MKELAIACDDAQEQSLDGLTRHVFAIVGPGDRFTTRVAFTPTLPPGSYPDGANVIHEGAYRNGWSVEDDDAATERAYQAYRAQLAQVEPPRA